MYHLLFSNRNMWNTRGQEKENHSPSKKAWFSTKWHWFLTEFQQGCCLATVHLLQVPSGGVCCEMGWRRDRLQQSFLPTAQSATAKLPLEAIGVVPPHTEAELAKDVLLRKAFSQLQTIVPHALQCIPSIPGKGHSPAHLLSYARREGSGTTEIFFHPPSSQNKSPNNCSASYGFKSVLRDHM